MSRVLFLVLAMLVLCCTNAERTRNHDRIVAEGPPSSTGWASIPVAGTLGWVYDPRSIARGDGKAYVWTRLPATNILVQYGFTRTPCRHRERYSEGHKPSPAFRQL